MTRVLQPDFNVDSQKVLLWRFSNANRLLKVVIDKEAYYAKIQTKFWNDWIKDVFDLRTANDFGLSVWSIILNLPLYTEQGVSPPGYPAFGFSDYGLNFDNSNFATDGDLISRLTTEDKRTVLRMRYYKLTSRGVTSDINKFYSYLFGPNFLWVRDNLNMTITYVFGQPPRPSLLYAIQNLDVLPTPAGVGYDFEFSYNSSFGFSDFGNNFDNSNFWYGVNP